MSRLEMDERGKERRTDHYVEHVFVLVHLSHDKAWGASNIGAPLTQHPILLHSEGIHSIIMVKAIGVYHRPEQWAYACDTHALMIKHTVHMLNVGLLAAPKQAVTLHKAICKAKTSVSLKCLVATQKKAAGGSCGGKGKHLQIAASGGGSM